MQSIKYKMKKNVHESESILKNPNGNCSINQLKLYQFVIQLNSRGGIMFKTNSVAIAKSDFELKNYIFLL